MEVGIDEMIAIYASRRGLSAEKTSLMVKVIDCESDFNPNAYNPHDPNSGSRGIAQFQNGTFKHFSKEAGLKDPDVWNPAHSLDVMAYMFSKNLEKHWSCTKIVQSS